jgi:hypothetical protein
MLCLIFIYAGLARLIKQMTPRNTDSPTRQEGRGEGSTLRSCGPKEVSPVQNKLLLASHGVLDQFGCDNDEFERSNSDITLHYLVQRAVRYRST